MRLRSSVQLQCAYTYVCLHVCATVSVCLGCSMYAYLCPCVPLGVRLFVAGVLLLLYCLICVEIDYVSNKYPLANLLRPLPSPRIPSFLFIFCSPTCLIIPSSSSPSHIHPSPLLFSSFVLIVTSSLSFQLFFYCNFASTPIRAMTSTSSSPPLSDPQTQSLPAIIPTLSLSAFQLPRFFLSKSPTLLPSIFLCLPPFLLPFLPPYLPPSLFLSMPLVLPASLLAFFLLPISIPSLSTCLPPRLPACFLHPSLSPCLSSFPPPSFPQR